MSEIGDEEFGARLQWLLSGRTITPWSKKLGLSAGTVKRMKDGHKPGSDILTALMRTENVSLNWIMEGKGLPFMLDVHTDQHAFMNMIRQHDSDADYTVYVSVDIERHLVAVIFAQPASYEFKNHTIEYTQIEVLVGPWSQALRNDVVHGMLFVHSHLQFFTMTDLEWKTFTRGQFGTYALLGDENHRGIVERQVNESAAAFFTPPGVMQLAADMAVQTMTVDSQDKVALLEKMNLFAKQQDLRLTKTARLDALSMLLEMKKPVALITQDDIHFAILANQEDVI